MVDISIAAMVQEQLLEQGMQKLSRLQALSLVGLRYGVINDDRQAKLTRGCDAFARVVDTARSELRARLLPGPSP